MKISGFRFGVSSLELNTHWTEDDSCQLITIPNSTVQLINHSTILIPNT